MDIGVNYLGLKLAHPFVMGASPLVDDLDSVRRRCRRRLQPDRATPGEDDHPRSSVRTRGGREVLLSSWIIVPLSPQLKPAPTGIGRSGFQTRPYGRRTATAVVERVAASWIAAASTLATQR
jgi:hypothetical protein